MKIGVSPVDRLIQALQGQRTAYAALLALYHENLQAMENWHIAALKPMLLEEQRLVRELHLQEQRRLSACSQLAREHGLPGDVTLHHDQLLSLVAEADRPRLQEVGEGLRQAMAQLKTLREPLLPVLQGALAFLTRHDKAATDDRAQPYGATGRVRPRANTRAATSFLDKKV